MYFPLFYFLGIIGNAWSVWYEALRLGPEASNHAIANAAIVKAPAVLLTAAFVSLFVTEATMVLAEMLGEYYAKRREKRAAEEKAVAAEAEAKGRAKGLAEGLAEGIEKGFAEGEERMSRQWAAWNQRRIDAEERGDDFDEPPPGPSDLNGANPEE